MTFLTTVTSTNVSSPAHATLPRLGRTNPPVTFVFLSSNPTPSPFLHPGSSPVPMACFLHHTLPQSRLVASETNAFLTWGDDDRRSSSLSASSSTASLGSVGSVNSPGADMVQQMHMQQMGVIMMDVVQHAQVQQQKRDFAAYHSENDHMMEQGYGYGKRRCSR